MSSAFLSFYVLIWPVAVACVLAVLVSAFAREAQNAHREGRSMI